MPSEPPPLPSSESTPRASDERAQSVGEINAEERREDESGNQDAGGGSPGSLEEAAEQGAWRRWTCHVCVCSEACHVHSMLVMADVHDPDM